MITCEECKYREIIGHNKFCRCHGAYIGWHGCENGERKPITNADRIRAMSDEELAEFMCHSVSPSGVINCSSCEAAEFCRMGHNGWLDWLKKEGGE